MAVHKRHEMEVADGDPCSSKDKRDMDVLETTEMPENGHMMASIAQLKPIYTNAHSMGNNQEELEAIVQQENYDIVAITETWWDDSHNWSAAMGGDKLFRRDRQGKRRGKANKADIMVGVCYRPPKQGEEAGEIFYKQLGEVSQSLVLVLVGDFNLPDVCWKYNTAERKQSRRFLECVADNFLTQLVREPTREGTMLDLLFANREGLVGGGVSRTASLDFRRADFGLFRSLVDKVPWEAVLKGKGVQEGWTFFRKEILKVQQQVVPMCRKMSQRGRRPAWLNKELWLELRKKRRVYDLWKKGQATQEDYKDVVRLCRKKIRRARAQLELNLATAIKDNKKCLYKNISNKRRAKENLHPLLDVGGNILPKDEEQAEVLNAFFASVFNSKTSYSTGTQAHEPEDRDGEQNEAPIIHREVSWLTLEVPVDWKLPNVMPFYKKGRKEDPGNYSPASLTSVPGKLMEQIILSAIT
ncbi:hypothetical protein QYF61_008316 [Mycteria americana]|uniref:Endonuclease/exonuclease/phosphatase domain-containing protein n=1 Tax=Mycteria americana TaxID=33587 RepID=A0AAN7NY82_MYCAM|nr:hypothetical protein QYF61_008316 [Mycteria americana]